MPASAQPASHRRRARCPALPCPAGVVDPPEPEERLVLGLTFSDVYYYLNIAYWWGSGAGRVVGCRWR